jgi:signal transduction histidine kinase
MTRYDWWPLSSIATKLAAANVVGIGLTGGAVAWASHLHHARSVRVLVAASVAVLLILIATAASHWLIRRHFKRLDDLCRVLDTIHKGALAGLGLPHERDSVVEGITESARNLIERLCDESLAVSAKLFASVEVERKRIGRELHDETSQALAAALIGIDLAERNASHDSAACRKHLGQARALIRHTLDELEIIIHDLRPVILDELGVVSALRWYLKTHVADPNLTVESDLAAVVRLPAAIEIALYRIAQDAIANVQQHAHATRMTVVLDIKLGYANLQVIDNGQGFDVMNVMGRQHEITGVGLLSMRERAEQLGGTCNIRSAPGKGTGVYAVIPLEKGVRRDDSQ